MGPSIAIPINKIQAAGRFCASVREIPLPRVLRGLQLFFCTLGMLRYITGHLSGQRIGQLSIGDAKALFELLRVLHSENNKILESHAQRGALMRRAFGWWTKALADENERIADILEALAWGFDEELRQYSSTSIAEIERQFR